MGLERRRSREEKSACVNLSMLFWNFTPPISFFNEGKGGLSFSQLKY